jgi:hypothetical protein
MTRPLLVFSVQNVTTKSDMTLVLIVRNKQVTDENQGFPLTDVSRYLYAFK